MCGITDKLILCSCSEQDVEKLSNYWVLQTPKKSMLFGQTMLPYYWDDKEEELTLNNAEKIQSILNQRNCFDKELEIREDDVLKLVFNTIQIEGRRKVYRFKFSENTWIYSEEADDFAFDEKDKGEIKNTVGSSNS